jgi:DNA-binding NarL/FixJ family response regulator
MPAPLKKRMLVVEHHDRFRESIRELLDQMDYQVTAVATVADGLAALSTRPHSILLDLVLPDGPGEAILEKVRAENLPCQVIICTIDHDEDRLTALRNLHPAAVLHKPLALSHLIAACHSPGR